MMIVAATVSVSSARTTRILHLSNNWLIQSSARTKVSGRVISSAGFNPTDWYRASVPSTVLGTLVGDGIFKDPFRGMNLERIPDTLFDVPWWYRTTFALPAKRPGADRAMLEFLGVNYKADIWLNGKLLADTNSIFGAFRQFTFDVTKDVKFGGNNVLAIRIYRPQPGALTIGFVDWSPEPPDHDMGIWRPVRIHICGSVSIARPFVATEVDTATLKKALVTVSAEVMNHSEHSVHGMLTGRIGAIKFSQPVTLLPHQYRIVAFLPSIYHQLIIHNPRLWWTHDFGKPNLYSLELQFGEDQSGKTRSVITDAADVMFGIRQINEYRTAQGFRGYKVNGKPILIRGGGWADHIFLDQDQRNVEDQIEYAINMHLNAIRMEGFWGTSSEIYRLCDKKGLLIMAGFSCQWEWSNYFGTPDDKFGCIRSPQDMETAAESFGDQVVWLRNHPSIFLWLYGSDKVPRPELERKFLDVLAKYDTTRPSLASAAEHNSSLTGPTGVKMRGPYDYVPPVYWYADTSHGGAFGFNTETGPGPEVPRIGSLEKMLSPDSLWPINGEWYFHCSRGNFGNLKRYNAAMNGRLGPPASLADYERKAQMMNYDGLRAMYEAFGANKFKSTGVIQWMYNTAWPKMWWQLYDYYLNPTGAFYGAQEACRPIHVAYDYATGGIYAINSTLKDSGRLKLEATAFDFTLKPIFTFDEMMDSKANSSEKITTIPVLHPSTHTYFLDLKLYRGRRVVDEDFYALSTIPDVINEKESTWYVTGSSNADLKELNDLPMVKLDIIKDEMTKRGDRYHVSVTLKNRTPHLAFMAYVSVKRGDSDETVLPVFWNTNYVSLFPGEERTVEGSFHARDLDGQKPRLEVSGWNVEQ